MSENRLLGTVTKHRIDAIESFNEQVTASIAAPDRSLEGSRSARHVKPVYRSNKPDQDIQFFSLVIIWLTAS